MKRLLSLLAAVLTVLLTGIPVCARESSAAIPEEHPSQSEPAGADKSLGLVQESAELPEENFRQQLEAAGADELPDQVPEDAKRLLDGAGITTLDYKQLLSLSPGDFFGQLWQMVLERVRQPLTIFTSVLGIILLCALLDCMKTALWEGTLNTVFSVVAILCVAAAIVNPIVDCISRTAQAINDCSNFILSFIPVFSSIVMAGGQPVTATTYTAFLFGACQVVSQVVSSTLVPLMGIYLAFCIAGNLAPGIDITAVARVIKNTVCWALGLLLTVFVGLLSLQTVVASGSDTVASKAAKFLIGSFVPVVGGALSDAFTATQGYMRLLKASVGVFGILAAALTFLPVLLQTAAWYLSVNIAAAISEMLHVKQVADILKSASATLGVLVAVILCYVILVIISTSLVLMATTGV